MVEATERQGRQNKDWQVDGFGNEKSMYQYWWQGPRIIPPLNKEGPKEKDGESTVGRRPPLGFFSPVGILLHWSTGFIA